MRLIPIASKAEDMVLAVYIPPQAPAPGMAFRSIASSSAWGILACLVLAEGLEDAHDVEVAALVAAGLDRAPVDEDRGDVEPREGDHRPRHVLVAAADRKHPVHRLRVADGLDRVRDHLARDEGVLHPLGPHRDPVGDGDRAEHLRHRPRGAERPPSRGRPGGPIPTLQGVRLLWAFATPTMGLAKSASPKPTARSIDAVGGTLVALGDRAAAAWGWSCLLLGAAHLNPAVLRSGPAGEANGR